MDAHPPVEKVAPAYQNVIGAMEEKETEILKAKAYEATVLPESEADAQEIIFSAESASAEARTKAAAESQRFASQLNAYRAMPSMFILNNYMDALESSMPDVRKILNLTGVEADVVQINLETRERLDLIDLDASELSNEPSKK